MIGQCFHALNLLVTKFHFFCADMTGPLSPKCKSSYELGYELGYEQGSLDSLHLC